MKKEEFKNWNEQTYQEYLAYLKSLKDENYKTFHSRLTTTKYEILGITVPMQRKIAKRISQSNREAFLKLNTETYYEEVMIKGLVLTSINEKEKVLNYLEDYVSLIDNWAICDSFCNSLKIVKTDKDFWFQHFKKYLNCKEEFKIRVALIIFLNFYIEENYLNEIFNLIDSIKIDKYYVNMGSAWLLCECFIKYREKTLAYLLKSKINTFTFNKTISKIKESYRVDNEDKAYLNTLKRKA
mgnify:CR=1 FL=1